MTQAKVRKLVKDWQTKLGLDAWDITVEFTDEPPGKEHSRAAISTSHDYDDATMYVRDDYDDWPDTSTEETVVHELLHVKFRDLEAVQRFVARQLALDTQLAIDDRWDHEVEGLIDSLAKTLVRQQSR